MIPKVKYYGPRIPSTYAVNMTAAASGSNGITVADDDDIDFGTGDFFLHWEGSLPDWTPASGTEPILFSKYVAGFGAVWRILPAGVIRISIANAAASGAVAFPSTVATGLANGASAKITVSVTRETASTNGVISFYVNGYLLETLTITAGSLGTMSGTATAYIMGDASVRFASNTIASIAGNFAPTASEVLDLCTNGIPASWKWGSQAASYTSNFSAGADSWTATRATAAGNIDGIGGADDWLRITSAAGNNTHLAERAGVFPSIAGLKYKVSLQYYIPSTNSNANQIRLYDGNDRPLSAFLGGTDTLTSVSFQTSNAPNSAALRVYMARNGDTFFDDVGADDVVYIKSIVVTKIGATMALLPDTIPTSSATTWSDTSGNTGGGTLPAAGATKVTIRR